MTDVFQRFADTWREHWVSEDAEAVAALYSPDVVHRPHPFRPPLQGLDELRGYLRASFAEEHAVDVSFSEPLVLGDSAVYEFWVVFDDGSTLAGTVFARFGPDGLVTEARDYWHTAPDILHNHGFFTHRSDL